MVNPLSRVTMQNILREKSPKVDLSKESKGVNLNDVENNIIKGIIRGEMEITESREVNAVITLEEAANRIKNNR